MTEAPPTLRDVRRRLRAVAALCRSQLSALERFGLTPAGEQAADLLHEILDLVEGRA